MFRTSSLATMAAALCLALSAHAQTTAEADKPAVFDAELARSLGANENGMRGYVFVLLKTGPNKVPAGAERDETFKGHFANMGRLGKEGKLALAGPLDGVDGWRGLYVFAVSEIEEARQLVATDPVIIKGEMVAEYHKFFGSAALMLVHDAHAKIAKKRF